MGNCINYRCMSTVKDVWSIELMWPYRNETISVCKGGGGRWKQRGDTNIDPGLWFHISAVFNQAPELCSRDGFVFCRVPVNTEGLLPSQKKMACMCKYASTRHQTSIDKTYTRIGWIKKSFFSVGVPSYTGNSMEEHYWKKIFHVIMGGFKLVFASSLVDQWASGYAGLAIPVHSLFSLSRFNNLTKDTL